MIVGKLKAARRIKLAPAQTVLASSDVRFGSVSDMGECYRWHDQQWSRAMTKAWKFSPTKEMCGTNLLSAVLRRIIDVGAACVQVVQINIIVERSIVHWWADGRYVELGLLLFHRLLCYPFSELLARKVSHSAVSTLCLLVGRTGSKHSRRVCSPGEPLM